MIAEFYRSVPMTQNPIVIDPNSFQARDILTRYSRQLLQEGARFYTRMSAWTEHFRTEEKVNWLKEGF